MTATKRKGTAPTGASLPIGTLPDAPEQLRQRTALGQAVMDMPQAAPAKNTTKTRRKPPDLHAVRRRLHSVAFTLSAIHNVAWRAADDKAEDREASLNLIWETARGAARTVDACLQQLGDTALGLFADDLQERS